MPLTEDQKQEFLKEALDTKKVILYCKTHNYFGPPKQMTDAKAVVKPAKGCQQCWMVFYFHDLASAPPHKRQERLDELTEVLRNVVQSVEQGKWDVNIFDKPQIEITKEYDA